MLAHGFRQHRGIIVFRNNPTAPFVGFEKRRRKAIKAKPAAAFPAGGLGHAALVGSVDDLCEARDDVGDGVVAQLDHDPAAAHFVSDRAGRAGTTKRV